MKTNLKPTVLACAVLMAAFSSPAQTAVPPPTPAYEPLSDDQLDQLLGPIALYPDPLIAQILPASTLPTQIVLADRYVNGGGDTNQIEQQPWDSSVQALAHYPTVLKWMDDNLAWTTELGQAFLNQQQDVMDSIQRLRAAAQKLGNLPSTPQQQVVTDGGQIEILPAAPQVIYVPVYDPDVIYYQTAFGPPFITFGVGFGIGAWLNCDFDWAHRHLVYWNHAHPRPANWWHEQPRHRDAVLASHPLIWHPVNRPAFVGSNRGNRGWFDNPAARRPQPATQPGHPNNVVHPAIHGNLPRSTYNFYPVNPPNHAVAPVIHGNIPKQFSPPAQHFVMPNRPAENNSAFSGIQSSRETRDFSRRGQTSMRSFPRPESPPQHFSPPSAPHSPPPSRGNGGGGWHGNSGSGRH